VAISFFLCELCVILSVLCGKKTLKIKNSGNQPEFQSSIKKRTVNQTVVCGTKVSSFMFQVTKAT